MIKNIQFMFFIMIIYLIVSCHSKRKTNENISAHIDSLSKGELKQVVFDTLSFIKNNKDHGNYPYASTDSLEDKDVQYISPSELRLIRNEIFAKNGYIFNSKELDQYFRKFEWYKPISKDVTNYLNEIEKKNIETIKRFEKINTEIKQKEQFAIFLDLVRSKEKIPRMLAHKFQEYTFNNLTYSHYKAEKILFEQLINYKYILYRFFWGCDDCKTDYCIKKFSLNGKFIDETYLGICDESKMEEKEDGSIYFTLINYSIPSDSYLDTVKWILKIDSNNNLLIKKSR